MLLIHSLQQFWNVNLFFIDQTYIISKNELWGASHLSPQPHFWIKYRCLRSLRGWTSKTGQNNALWTCLRKPLVRRIKKLKVFSRLTFFFLKSLLREKSALRGWLEMSWQFMSGVFLDSVCLSTSSSSSHISPKHIHPLVTAVTHQSTLHGLKKKKKKS